MVFIIVLIKTPSRVCCLDYTRVGNEVEEGNYLDGLLFVPTNGLIKDRFLRYIENRSNPKQPIPDEAP